MDKQQLQALRDLPIEGVAERLGLELRQHKALCPFHDDHHPSLSFNVRRNTFRCFVCDAHGGTIDLVMKTLHKDFREACEWLNPYSIHTPSPLLSHKTLPGMPLASLFPNLGGERLARSVTVPSGSSPKLGGESDSTTASASSSPKLGEQQVTGSRPSSSPKLGEVAQRAGGVCTPFDASRYERFFERPWLSEAARRFLFDERRLDPRVVRWCRLTSWRDRQGVEWLQIPYYDREGKLIGIQNRNLGYRHTPSPLRGTPPNLGGEPEGTTSASNSSPKLGEVDAQRADGGVCLPRFRFPRGSQCGIYNLPVIGRLHEGEALYITEGCSDCWAMLSAGHKAIAIPSATLLTKKTISDLRLPTSELHMFPDRDAPGERLFLQLKALLPDLQHHQLPPDCKDYGDYFVKLKIEN